MLLVKQRYVSSVRGLFGMWYNKIFCKIWQNNNFIEHCYLSIIYNYNQTITLLLITLLPNNVSFSETTGNPSIASSFGPTVATTTINTKDMFVYSTQSVLTSLLQNTTGNWNVYKVNILKIDRCWTIIIQIAILEK